MKMFTVTVKLCFQAMYQFLQHLHPSFFVVLVTNVNIAYRRKRLVIEKQFRSYNKLVRSGKVNLFVHRLKTTGKDLLQEHCLVKNQRQHLYKGTILTLIEGTSKLFVREREPVKVLYSIESNCYGWLKRSAAAVQIIFEEILNLYFSTMKFSVLL